MNDCLQGQGIGVAGPGGTSQSYLLNGADFRASIFASSAHQ